MTGTRRPRAAASVPSGTERDGVQPLDGLIHHRIRLGIVSALVGVEALSFNELKALLKLTDGNLSVHARKLEEAKYIECKKFFQDRRPRTDYRLTTPGRKALQRYVDHMEALIQAARTTLER
jgi:DNA-binding HxlR family transcriptional regulator